MQDDPFLEEILERIRNARPNPGYRAYHDGKGNVICFSQEYLDHEFVIADEHTYHESRPDLYRVVDGKLVRKEQFYQNRNQLRTGTTYATLSGDMQFAVDADWIGNKDLWDANS